MTDRIQMITNGYKKNIHFFPCRVKVFLVNCTKIGKQKVTDTKYGGSVICVFDET